MEQTDIVIDEMRAADVPDIARLEAACFAAPWSADTLAAALARGDWLFLVARRGESLLGYCGMQHVLDEGYIANVAVFPQARRQGAAMALMAALRARAQALGLSFLTLEVRESNSAALALYAACGYRSAGRRRGFYEHPREDALIMTLYLKGDVEG